MLMHDCTPNYFKFRVEDEGDNVPDVLDLMGLGERELEKEYGEAPVYPSLAKWIAPRGWNDLEE